MQPSCPPLPHHERSLPQVCVVCVEAGSLNVRALWGSGFGWWVFWVWLWGGLGLGFGLCLVVTVSVPNPECCHVSRADKGGKSDKSDKSGKSGKIDCQLVSVFCIGDAGYKRKLVWFGGIQYFLECFKLNKCLGLCVMPQISTKQT